MTYQTRQRAPLMDGYWQRFIKRRSKEFFGLSLIAAGCAMVGALLTYSASDPGMFSATNGDIENMFGPTGAAFASPLMITVGMSSWCFAAFLLIWGLRYIIHSGSARILDRLIFMPIAVMLGSVYAATFGATDGWEHHFGIGGMFGDTVFSAAVNAWPGDPSDGIKHISLIVLLLFATTSFLALGFTLGEMKSISSGFARAVFSKRSKRKKQNPAHSKRVALEDEYEEIEFEDEIESSDEIDEPVRRKRTRGRFGRLFGGLWSTAGSRIVQGIRNSRDVEIDEVQRHRLAPQPPLTRNTIPEFDKIAPTSGPSKPEENEPLVRPSPKTPLKLSRKAKKEAHPPLLDEPVRNQYDGPPLALLQEPVQDVQTGQSSAALQDNARLLENTLEDYGVKGEIEAVRPGPVVTLYELSPAPGLKASRVIGLSDDIARSMSALSARISTVPGRSVIGIELPNSERETVYLRELIATREFGDSNMGLPIALGKDIGGSSVVVDLSKMPHLLIAGTTGSGKSVAINTMILSILYRQSPEDCRMIMIDPKMLELSVYDGIPHLLSPVVTDPKKAVVALKWVVAEMEDRYRMMSKMGVRNINGYNNRINEALRKNTKLSRTIQTGFDERTGDPIYETEEVEPETLPFIVVIVDEMADLMMVAGKDIEACVQRLAQMARASGIHLIMATQRPSVDVITGTVKANFPTRVSFQVTSKIDSRTILGEQGAEQLLGMGDMLYMAGGGKISRVHGPFVSDEEVEQVVNYLKQFGEPEYVDEVLEGPSDEQQAAINGVLGLGGNSGDDAEYDQAVAIVLRDRKCSTSYIQRRMEIGYNKAARLVERMEENGIISSANHVGKREILVPE